MCWVFGTVQILPPPLAEAKTPTHESGALAFSNQVHAVLIICPLLYNVYQNPSPIAKFIMFWPLFWVGGVADCVFGGGTPLEILQRVGSTTVALVAGFLCYFINWLLVTGDIGL
eukprot:COSAG02_NODE_2755_length_8085_cov_6.024418_4_plen_114_part_00